MRTVISNKNPLSLLFSLACLILICDVPRSYACLENCDGEVVLNHLTGFVEREDQPIKGVTIDIFRAKPCAEPLNEKVRSVKTGGAGFFDTGALPPGRYRMVFNIQDETRELIIKVVATKKNLESEMDLTVPRRDGRVHMACMAEEVRFHILQKTANAQTH